MPRIIGAKEIANLLRVTQRHFRRMRTSGEFLLKPKFTVGNRPKWEEKEVLAYLRLTLPADTTAKC